MQRGSDGGAGVAYDITIQWSTSSFTVYVSNPATSGIVVNSMVIGVTVLDGQFGNRLYGVVPPDSDAANSCITRNATVCDRQTGW